MKVQVSINKKPAVKVEVTLAKTRRSGYRVQIPVRIARNDEQPLPVAEQPIAAADDATLEQDYAEPAEIEENQPVEECLSPASQLPEDEPVDIPDDTEIDEGDLLALIEEEEAEMSAQLQQEAIDDVENSFDKAAESAYFFAEDDLPVDAQHLTESDADIADEPASGTEQFYRYFGRNTNGERFEVDDADASGQEIVCVDGESGRISRVCGFIKHNQPVADSEENSSSDEE